MSQKAATNKNAKNVIKIDFAAFIVKVNMCVIIGD
jgi:hypothetical protein